MRVEERWERKGLTGSVGSVEVMQDSDQTHKKVCMTERMI